MVPQITKKTWVALSLFQPKPSAWKGEIAPLMRDGGDERKKKRKNELRASHERSLVLPRGRRQQVAVAAFDWYY